MLYEVITPDNQEERNILQVIEHDPPPAFDMLVGFVLMRFGRGINQRLL